MKPKKATPKPAEPKHPTADERYADYAKALIEERKMYVRLSHKYNELKADYLELAESVSALSATSTRILKRYSIGRTTVYGQGFTKPQF
jgi:hypothetical protein